MNKKQYLIFNQAKDLFWKHGFRRVSVEEICRNAHVSKMTFYKFYPNKFELAKSIYESIMEEGLSKFHGIIHDESPAEEKIRSMLLLKKQSTDNISKEFLMDFYTDTETGLKEFIEQKTIETWRFFIDDFEFAMQTGIFRADINAELLLKVSQKFIELANDHALLQLYKNPQDLIMALAELFIYGILPDKK